MTPVPHRAQHLAEEVIDGDVLLFDGTELHLLAGTSALIWHRIDGWADAAAIARDMAEEFATPASPIEADVAAFVSHLAGKGLVEYLPADGRATFTQAPQVGWALDGELVVLGDLDTGRRQALSPTGSRIWQLVCDHQHVQPVVEALRAEFPEAPDSLEADVLDFLETLVGQGLLLRRG